MGLSYEETRRAAYQLKVGKPLRIDYRILGFPEQLSDAVLKVCNLDRAGKEPFRSAPTYRLNNLLQTLVSEVAVMRRGPVSGNSPAHGWLYHPAARPDPLPENVRRRLLSVWLQDLRPEPEFQDSVREALGVLDANSQGWSSGSVDLLESGTSSGGTATPSSLQYVLVTDYFARRIQEWSRRSPYRFEGGELRFRAVAQGARQEGAELMSQPLEYKPGRRSWWFSVLVTLRLHTAPFDPRPRLHVHLGLRRWATNPNSKTGSIGLPYQTDTSVYLRPSEPWLPTAPVSERFGVARITWDRDSRQHRWHHGGPAAMLSRLALMRPFPDVSALLSDPTPWLDSRLGMHALVVHSTRMGQHAVRSGLMSHQRSQIMEWLEAGLGAELERLPDLRRSRLHHDSPENVRAKSSGRKRSATDDAARTRRASIARGCLRLDEAGRPVFEARLLWLEPQTRDLAVQGLVDVLDLDGDGGLNGLTRDETGLLSWTTDELVIRLRCRRLASGLADQLGVDPRSRSRRKDHAAAVTRRRAEMAAFLTADGTSSAGSSLAVVAIPPSDAFEGRGENDPKFALRLGAADVGALTQFIAERPGGSGDTNRAKAAWMDGFRQLGASVVPVPRVSDGLPAGTQYLAIWMAACRRDTPTRPARKFPVAVLVRPEPNGTDSVLGWDPSAEDGVGGWTSYAKLLTMLPRLAGVAPEDLAAMPGEDQEPRLEQQRKLDQQRRQTGQFIQKVLYSPELRERPTVLLAHAQNSRHQWTWLQDGTVRKDMIRTGLASASRLHPWLRLVRIRTGDQGETPQWWGIAPGAGVNGLPAGLWTQPGPGDTPTIDARVFYSTTAKAVQFRDSAVEADVLAPRPIRRGKRRGELTLDTNKQGWNPGLVEIVVLGCHPDRGDIPEVIAMAVHQQRQAPDYGDALRLPLPLHLARLAQEYVLPTSASDGEVADVREADLHRNAEESVPEDDG
ncbi:pPIWI_RE module domain-containing protein [Micromonospora echinospora]|uniref:pPIWI_RE module domain-containing protein n=1 Tax=Micromonospora echinospora TaxID=1877 RepID=UPI003672AFC0